MKAAPRTQAKAAADLKAQVAALAARKDELTRSLESLEQEIENRRQERDDIEPRATVTADLEAQVAALATRKDELTYALEGLEQEIENRLEAKLALDTTADEHSRTLTDGIVRDLSDREQALTATIAALQEEADQRQTRLEELDADVASLTRTKEALDEAVGVLLERQRDIDNASANADQDVEARRSEKIAEMESAIAAQKEIALNKIMVWSEVEKSRLQARFDKEYQAEVATWRRRLLEMVNTEFDKIHEYFSAFAAEEKVIAEKDIQDFLAEKRSTIVSGLE
ncbi:MAG: hypothetical protein H7840_06710 [Alphaproteobacteria bacterium]